MLETVHLILGRDDAAEAWLDRVRRVVVPGGTVRVERPPVGLWSALRRVDTDPETTGPIDTLVAGLREQGFTASVVPFSSPIAPDAVVWVPRARSAVVVAALLHRASSVLWADGLQAPDRLGVWVPDDPLRLPRTVAAVAARSGTCTLRVFASPHVVDDIREAREILQDDSTWEIHPLHGRGPLVVAGLEAALAEAPVDVLCVGLAGDGLRAPLLGMLRSFPTDLWIVLDTRSSPGTGTLATCDAVAVGPGTATVAFQCIGPLVWTPEDSVMHRVQRGVVRASVELAGGRLRWAPADSGVQGLCTDPDDAAGSLVGSVRVLPRAGRPILVVGWPSTLPPDLDRSEYRVWACLFQPHNPELLRDEGVVDAVLHPDAVLDRGTPSDLPDQARGITLGRVVRRLRLGGYPVVGHLDVAAGERVPADGPRSCGASLSERLIARCGARPTRVDTVSWTTCGGAARRELLALIAGARHTIDFQVYIFENDAVGEAVRDALVSAARRGVQVRVLVDSVWSGHGAFSRENPLLAELAAIDGATVASSRPVDGVVDLKARDHRKLVVVDGTVALLPGRNVGAHYYTGFDEVDLQPSSDQRHVPWFDLSACVTGPVVAEATRSFAGAWADATQTHLPPMVEVPSGAPNAHWIDHRSLQDAHGLDAFRELLDEARQRVVLVNTFAIQHELQHALVQCLERGVAVTVYTGHVRPRFDSGREPFVGSPERDLATGVIHGRFEALVAAGAEVFALGVQQPHWPAVLGTVLPHVHSKLWVVDDRYVVAGSHNIDIASAYWESEVVLVLDAPAEAAHLTGWLRDREPLARAFHGQDGVPDWREPTRQPEWLSQYWPSLLS